MVNFFENCKTLDELKKEYKAAAIQHHPDLGGNTAIMQQVNSQYEKRFEELKHIQNEEAATDTTGKTQATTEAPTDFIRIIEILLNLDGITVELCGRWLWIGGNTMPHRESLRNAGCCWSQAKKLWHWNYAEDSARWHKGKKTMQQIRNTYGSTTFVKSENEKKAITA